jgi:hypothetical protein
MENCTFRSNREYRSTSERVINEPRLGSSTQFELDRFGAHPEVLGKTRVSGFGRFSFHRQRASVTEIGPNSTQATSERGKSMIVANLGTSGGGDG